MKLVKNTRKCVKRDHFCSTTMERRILFFEALEDSLDFPTAFSHAIELVRLAGEKRKEGSLCRGCIREFLATIREFDKATGAFPF